MIEKETIDAVAELVFKKAQAYPELLEAMIEARFILSEAIEKALRATNVQCGDLPG